jgi:NTE family protein
MADDIAALLADRGAGAEERQPRTREGTGLCLSGGGYRAMLFHAGTLMRLNELAQLSELDFISSVSGGSITAGVLARNWSRLQWSNGVALNLRSEVIDVLMNFADRTVDRGSIIQGLVRPGSSIGEQVTRAYEKHLFGDATLQSLPSHPRFVFTAANLQSGALWRFSKRYMGDWRVGRVTAPDVPLAVAVAASSAFPPVPSPVTLRVAADAWSSDDAPLGTPEFRREIVLSDGGVYDNLGLEPVIKRCETVLVSDGGGKLKAKATIARTWIRHTRRVLGVIDQQVRNLRSRLLVDGYERGDYRGAYWGIRTPIERYDVEGKLSCPTDQTQLLAETPTRLAALPMEHRQRLANWGYAACDAAIRQRVLPDAKAPEQLPWPAARVGPVHS